MLTRSQFDRVCKAFAAKHGWTWVEKYPYGYLARSQSYSRATGFDVNLANLGDDPDLEPDAATAVRTGSGLEDVISQQSIVFSAGFQVPAFYFTAYNTNGAPLSLAQLMETTLFRFAVPRGSEANGFALTLPDAPFPLLSQGEHPTLGTPCWYLHPCETSNAVDELFKEVVQIGWNEQERLIRWLEMWLMVVSGVLRL